MSFWLSIKTALESVFSQATGIPFVWEEDAPRVLRPPVGVLELGQSMTVGRDGHSYTFRDSDISLNLMGHRELTIGIQIISRRAKNVISSRILAERARLAMANPVYRDALRSAGLVLIECHPITNLDFSHSRRKELSSSFDVVFSLTVQEQQILKNASVLEYGDIEGEFVEY